MLFAPVAVVVGARDVDAVAARLRERGPLDERVISLDADAAAALYGLEAGVDVIELRRPDRDGGAVRLVPTRLGTDEVSELLFRLTVGERCAWPVAKVDLATPFWRAQGLQPVEAGASVSGGRVVLLEAASTGLRVELTQEPEPPAAAPRVPVRPGLHALVFDVADLDAAITLARGADVGAVAAVDGTRAVRGHAPEGIAFELWERKPAETPRTFPADGDSPVLT